ncbi:glutathione peroxidase [freshwater metagenome]|jgi:glutathione peroxidase|uniref:Glutathione peroxidase n=1 Tax=freshwater metagenome TaxID=449393 RepID=A0A094SGN5_9ZZZZ
MSKPTSIYDLEFTDNRGNLVSLADYSGKPILIVNTASKCGFTPQYEGLQKLNEEFREQGLIVLGFPCDQFAHQEPGNDQEIDEFCKVNFGVDFPLSQKVNVNGKNAHPIFKFLKENSKSLLGGTVKWNFTKFLISPDGKSIKRYSPNTTPENIRTDVLEILPS